MPKQASGFTALSSPAKEGPVAAGPVAGTLAQAPDPRILDWVLGSRGSLADKGLGGASPLCIAPVLVHASP